MQDYLIDHRHRMFFWIRPKHEPNTRQMSPELKEALRYDVESHYRNYTRGFIDKITIPVYLFVSGPGTGKSRNASEFSDTIRKCFDGTFFKEENDELATRLENEFVLHVSLKDFQKDDQRYLL